MSHAWPPFRASLTVAAWYFRGRWGRTTEKDRQWARVVRAILAEGAES